MSVFDKAKQALEEDRKRQADIKAYREHAKAERETEKVAITADRHAEDAKRATSQGARFYLLRWANPRGGKAMTSGLPETIAAIEDLGWKLETMSWYYDAQQPLPGPEGMFLFRRAE